MPMNFGPLQLDDPTDLKAGYPRVVRALRVNVGKPIIIDYGKDVEPLTMSGYIAMDPTSNWFEHMGLKIQFKEIANNPLMMPLDITFTNFALAIHDGLYTVKELRYEETRNPAVTRYRLVAWRVDPESALYFNIGKILVE